jgi:hypothetical protein
VRPTWTRTPKESAKPGGSTSPQPQVPRDQGVWRAERAIAGFRRSSDRSDQVPARSRHLQGEPPVSQEELEAVVHEYRRLDEEHRRARPQSSTRRRLEKRLRRLGERFDHLLAEAPLSDPDRRRWRDRLRGPAAHPEPPSTGVRPLLFCGRSDSGSELRLRLAADGTIDALVDGAAAAVFDDAEELNRTTPDLTFAIDQMQFRETFGASPSSLGDLRAALEAGRRPRRMHIRELVEDGLLDRTLNLTARGRRALALDIARAPHRDVGPRPTITLRGTVSTRARDTLARALARAARDAPRPALTLTGSLTRHADPALPRPVIAKAVIAMSGQSVRAHAAAASETEAIAVLESRLHRNLRTLAERDLALRREEGVPKPGEWRHGDLASPRPDYFPRPPAERRLIGRRTYASAPMTPAAAAAEMVLLDHDFHVFVDEASGDSALVYSRPDGRLALRQPNGTDSGDPRFVLDAERVPTMGIEDAVERLDLGDDPFLFFLDTASGHGAVLYRRYDGHYGLVSAEPGHDKT